MKRIVDVTCVWLLIFLGCQSQSINDLAGADTLVGMSYQIPSEAVCSGATQPYDPNGDCCGDCLGAAICSNPTGGNCQLATTWGVPLVRVSCANTFYSTISSTLSGYGVPVQNLNCQFATSGAPPFSATIPKDYVCRASYPPTIDASTPFRITQSTQPYSAAAMTGPQSDNCCGDCWGNSVCANPTNQNCRFQNMFYDQTLMPVSCSNPLYAEQISDFTGGIQGIPCTFNQQVGAQCCSNGTEFCLAANQTTQPSTNVVDYNCDTISNFKGATAQACPAGQTPQDCLYPPTVVTQTTSQCCGAWNPDGQLRYCYVGPAIQTSSAALNSLCQAAFPSSDFFAQPLACDGNLQPACPSP